MSLLSYKKGNQLIITKTFSNQDFFTIGEIVVVTKLVGSLMIVKNSKKQNLVVSSTQCELLSIHRRRILNDIINA